ncbi:MAG: sensor histidine kinase [Flavobacterium sp.]|nr:MAG: sensor histidine kinase [Flavobacterium sp.]
MTDGRSVRNEVSSLYSDSQGGMWLGTLNRGLLYSHSDRFRFNHIADSAFGNLARNNFAVLSFFDLRNQLYIGATNGLFFGNFNGTNTKFNKIASFRTNSIIGDKLNQIWVCTSAGLFSLNNEKLKQWTDYEANNLCVIENNQLYLLSNEKGLEHFNVAKQSFTKIKLVNLRGEPAAYPTQLVRWKNWLVGISDAGLFIYDPKNDKCLLAENLSEKWKSLTGFNNEQYNCIYADSRGLLWVGTQDGLNVWNEANGKVLSFHDEDGLPGNFIMGIVEDKGHSVWITTSKGMSRIMVGHSNPGYNFTFNNYNEFDGLLSNGFTQRSAYISQGNRLFAGGQDGLNHIDLKDIPKTEKKLIPLFTSFELFGKEVKQGDRIGGSVILPNSISYSNEINLRYDQNFIALKFSGLNFINPVQTYYKYFLEGVDRDWQQANVNNGIGMASYTNLSPGTYLFKVRAADNNKNWNGKIATITIRIYPPWWFSWIAIVVYILLFSGVAIWLFKWYNAFLRNKRLKKQQEEIEEMKFSFITNLSHELRTPLTLILTPLDVIIKKIDDANLRSKLSNIYNNALNLLDLVNQLLDFRRLEFSGETLNLSLCEIELLIEDVSASFSEVINLKQIHFDLNVKVSNKWVFRFVSHPDYRPGDLSFIGKLLPDSVQKEENLRVTFIPRQTGMAQTFDINNDILKDFIFYSEGYYEIPYVDNLKYEHQLAKDPQNTLLARFETTLPDQAYAGKKVEYLMKTEDIIVSGNEDTRDEKHIFKIPSEWVNTPHLKIRFDNKENKFYLASFGEKTIVNEILIERSDINGPKWSELPVNSRIILNGIIGINIFKP